MRPLGLGCPLERIQKYFRDCAGPVEAIFPVMPAPGLGFMAAYRWWYPENTARDVCKKSLRNRQSFVEAFLVGILHGSMR